MAAPKSQDPLDVLQLMVNDVLVHTGKALRASRKDGVGNIAQAQSVLQAKIPETVRTYQSALDDIEHDILRAKAVLQRDLQKIRDKRQPVQPVSPVQEVQEFQSMQETQPAPQDQELPEVQEVQEVEEPQQPQELHPFQDDEPIQPILRVHPAPSPQPIESQSKSPMIIDLDSSPPPNDQPMTETKASKPMAPFPDMGMGLPDLDQVGVMIKKEFAASNTATPDTTNNNITAKAGANEFQPPLAPAQMAPAPMAPMPPMDENHIEDDVAMSGTDANLSGSELNFTNMQFTLAPTNNDAQNPPSTQEPSFDLATFAPAETGDALLSLNMLQPDPPEQPIADPPPNPQEILPESAQIPAEPTGEDPDSAFDDLYYMDTDAGYGAAGGMTDDTFNELMDARDDNYGLMEHGEFDDSYFGIGKPE
ncbi:hypothetical protein G7046_g3834 [Stylonectria norvegica]|nr:hypothetical protein G7046_g3834 [Stylonectria norvegica]